MLIEDGSDFGKNRRATLSGNRPALADGAQQKGQVGSAPVVGTRPLTPSKGISAVASPASIFRQPAVSFPRAT